MRLVVLKLGRIPEVTLHANKIKINVSKISLSNVPKKCQSSIIHHKTKMSLKLKGYD